MALASLMHLQPVLQRMNAFSLSSQLTAPPRAVHSMRLQHAALAEDLKRMLPFTPEDPLLYAVCLTFPGRVVPLASELGLTLDLVSSAQGSGSAAMHSTITMCALAQQSPQEQTPRVGRHC